MELDLFPAPPTPVRLAVIAAVAKAALRLEQSAPAGSSAWRRTALEESVERDPLAVRLDYAFSPRRTRGATRA
jgi:hypothetical protein